MSCVSVLSLCIHVSGVVFLCLVCLLAVCLLVLSCVCCLLACACIVCLLVFAPPMCFHVCVCLLAVCLFVLSCVCMSACCLLVCACIVCLLVFAPPPCTSDSNTTVATVVRAIIAMYLGLCQNTQSKSKNSWCAQLFTHQLSMPNVKNLPMFSHCLPMCTCPFGL